MSNNYNLSEIKTVRFSEVKYASLSNIKSYFKNFDQNNISEAFDATRNKQKKVITAKEWPAFTKKFYNLQVKAGIASNHENSTSKETIQ
ncbi:25211_t:CDS:2, partial [Gigaspora rosea]